MSRIKRDPRSAGNAPLILALIIAIAMLGLNLYAPKAEAQLQWASAPKVYIDHANSPIPQGDMEIAVKYAIWQWAQRTAVNAQFMGSTSGTASEGQIVFRWASLSEMASIASYGSYGAAQGSFYTDTGFMASSTIYINSGYVTQLDDVLRRTIAHEYGHALGTFTHSTNYDDVMSSGFHSRYHLTAGDVALTAYKHQSCFASLGPDNSIYIQDIQGQRALLKNIGGMDWKIEHLTTNPAASGCAVATIDENMTLSITRIKGQSIDVSARFVWMGNDTFRLEYASNFN